VGGGGDEGKYGGAGVKGGADNWTAQHPCWLCVWGWSASMHVVCVECRVGWAAAAAS